MSRDALLLFGAFRVGRRLPLLGRWIVGQTHRLGEGPEFPIPAGTWLLDMGLPFFPIVGLAFGLLTDTRGRPVDADAIGDGRQTGGLRPLAID